jgi:hypothetical protein
MAVPRPVLLALLGLGLVASLFLFTRSGSNESVHAPAKAAVSPTVPAPAPHRAGPHKAVAPAGARRPHAAASVDKPDNPPHSDRPAATPARPAPAKAPAVTTLSGRVLGAAQALAANQVVVFFFSSAGPADDTGARVAVDSLRKVPGVHVFDATLDEVAAFRPMLSSVGISQVPSTVIVRPGKKAVLIQGFVDGGTLRQNVADALR